MFDVARSLAIAKTIPVEKKACYANALLAFLCTKAFHDGWYVEGFAIPAIKGLRLPVEHGWVELPDGSIIDVSFATLGHTDVRYFPAIRFTFAQSLRLVKQDAALPRMLLQRTPRNRAAYLKSQQLAYQSAFGTTI
jgi:hypothetical protein